MADDELAAINYDWIRVRPLADADELEFVCDRCLTKHTTGSTMTRRDLRRAAYDFLIRHKLCLPPKVH